MRLVNGIANGVVIDHITAGRGMIVYNKLKLDENKCTTVLLLNVESKHLGRKDIIKIEDVLEIDATVLGLIDQNITLNYINDGKLIDKKTVEVPKIVKNIFKCSNPRCITHSDDYATSTFTLKNQNGVLEYQCNYCEEITKYKVKNDK
jgi:aspartate carbamoyltransferase regulatory subunit